MLKKNKKKNKSESGFVVLIAVMVSIILLSIGAFIATVAIREIALSSSAKESQKAFFAADSVLECALLKEFKLGGFSSDKYTNINTDSSLSCNGKKFTFFSSDMSALDYAVHVYYISLANEITDIDNNGLIDKNEIDSDDRTIDKPYIKLIVKKAVDYRNDSVIQVFGHNHRDGLTIIERAIEVIW